MYHFFIYFWLAFLALFLVLLARQGIQNRCPNCSGKPKNDVLAAVIAEGHEKVRFLSLVGMIFRLIFYTFLVLCCMMLLRKQKHFRKAAISKPHRTTNGSASKILFSQNSLLAKKTKKYIKKRFKNMSGNKARKLYLLGSIFL